MANFSKFCFSDSQGQVFKLTHSVTQWFLYHAFPFSHRSELSGGSAGELPKVLISNKFRNTNGRSWKNIHFPFSDKKI